MGGNAIAIPRFLAMTAHISSLLSGVCGRISARVLFASNFHRSPGWHVRVDVAAPVSTKTQRKRISTADPHHSVKSFGMFYQAKECCIVLQVRPILAGLSTDRNTLLSLVD